MSAEQRVCILCGREGTRGFRDGALAACSNWRACMNRQHENYRLRERCVGSIRYSGDTFDRVERLKAMPPPDIEASP